MRGAAVSTRRAAFVVVLAGVAVSAAMSSASPALAGLSTQPGNVVLNPPSGALSSTPTWSTLTGCPAGFQGSAQLAEFAYPGGTLVSRISPAIANVTTSFSGTLDANVGQLLAADGITATTPGTLEWAVGCWTGAGGNGTVQYVQSVLVTVSAGATTYATSTPGGGPPTSTVTTLTASPNPAAPNGTVTLTATVVGSDGSFPAGNVQFEANGINVGLSPDGTVGNPFPVNAGNMSAPASATTTFAAGGNESLTAVFTPASFDYTGSAGTWSEGVIGTISAGGTNPVPLNVTVSSTGTLSVTVAAGSVTLTPASPATTPDETATGTLNQVTVNDTRNNMPGWSVSGQESAFTEAVPGTATISANSLGWTPAFVGSAIGGAMLGPTVAPVGANTGSTGPGLGTAATLAQALPGSGFGTNNLNAALLLDIPALTPPGAYSGQMTITYVTAGP